MYVKKINHYENLGTKKLMNELLQTFYLIKQQVSEEFIREEIKINLAIGLRIIECLESVLENNEFIQKELMKVSGVLKSIVTKVELIPDNYKEDSEHYCTYCFLICNIKDKIVEIYYMIKALIPYYSLS